MTKAVVLIIYMTTNSANGGMTLATAEFGSRETCEAAAQETKKAFKSLWTNHYYVCAPKD